MVNLVNLVACEILKLKRSKMLLLSMLGALATPCLMFMEALHTHYDRPELVFTLADIYKDSLLYMMLLTNMTIYVAITAFVFSREYAENTLKTLLPVPVSRISFLSGKFFVLLLWTSMLTVLTWAGILVLLGLYHLLFGLEGFAITIALEWLGSMLLGSLLMFLTLTPFAYIAEKTKGIAAPMIASAVVIMSSAALSNQNLGALYPWTATFFLIQGRTSSTGYPIWLSAGVIALLFGIGLYVIFRYFLKEDLK